MYNDFTSLLEDFRSPDFFFIQIGANDGITDDDLRQHILRERWRGIMVEPLPDVFERLRENYRDHGGLEFINAAVVKEAGPVEFLRHPRYSQCSGMSVRTRMQSRVRMEKVQVEGMTMGTLLAKCSRLDLLQIDTEGYDGEIVRMLPADGIRPMIIRFEHKHLTMDDRNDLHALLRGRNYEIMWEEHDTIAFTPLLGQE